MNSFEVTGVLKNIEKKDGKNTFYILKVLCHEKYSNHVSGNPEERKSELNVTIFGKTHFTQIERVLKTGQIISLQGHIQSYNNYMNLVVDDKGKIQIVFSPSEKEQTNSVNESQKTNTQNNQKKETDSKKESHPKLGTGFDDLEKGENNEDFLDSSPNTGFSNDKYGDIDDEIPF